MMEADGYTTIKAVRDKEKYSGQPALRGVHGEAGPGRPGHSFLGLCGSDDGSDGAHLKAGAELQQYFGGEAVWRQWRAGVEVPATGKQLSEWAQSQQRKLPAKVYLDKLQLLLTAVAVRGTAVQQEPAGGQQQLRMADCMADIAKTANAKQLRRTDPRVHRAGSEVEVEVARDAPPDNEEWWFHFDGEYPKKDWQSMVNEMSQQLAVGFEFRRPRLLTRHEAAERCVLHAVGQLGECGSS
eukprot:SAG22_NODE_287_length_12963_cov_21.279086_1_plen_239_part_10